MSYRYEDIKKFELGQGFWECDQYSSVEYTLVELPVVGHHKSDGREYIDFFGESVKDKEKVSFRITKGLEHYGPKLYPYNAYSRF